MNFSEAKPFSDYGSFEAVQEAIETNDGKIFLFLGESKHKIKKKAEQTACRLAIELIKNI